MTNINSNANTAGKVLVSKKCPIKKIATITTKIIGTTSAIFLNIHNPC
jgi:hypothetical protein